MRSDYAVALNLIIDEVGQVKPGVVLYRLQLQRDVVLIHQSGYMPPI